MFDSQTAPPDQASPPDGGPADALLAEMAAAGQVTHQPMQLISGSVSTARRPKMRYSHQAMADLIVENPAIKQNEIAIIFDRTPGWVSTIITSDAFQCLLASRKAELVDPEITLSHRERFGASLTRSLQVLQEKLARPAGDIPDNLVLRAIELGTKGLGIGAHAPPPVVPNANEYLPAIADRLARLTGRPLSQPISDATVIEG